MNAMAKSIFLAAVALVTTLPANADWDGGGVRDRLEYNRSLIQRGIDSGDLTEREARRLWREHREIRELNDELRDSEMPREERHRIIHPKLDREERHIRRLLENDRTENDDEHRGEDWPPLPPGFRRDL